MASAGTLVLRACAPYVTVVWLLEDMGRWAGELGAGALGQSGTVRRYRHAALTRGGALTAALALPGGQRRSTGCAAGRRTRTPTAAR